MYKITDIINKETKDNIARFSFYRNGKLYYNIIESNKASWEFPIDITDTNDIGNATFPYEIKSITLMRYIRKAIDSDNLIKLY